MPAVVKVMVMVLVLAQLTLTSLCYGSPPDPTWIAGFYDDGAHDDVVMEVVDTAAVPAAAAPHVFAPAPRPEAPSIVGGGVLRPLSVTALLDRSPPLA